MYQSCCVFIKYGTTLSTSFNLLTVITWCADYKVEHLPSHDRCVWASVVHMEPNSSPSDQIWSFLGDCFLQLVQWLTVYFRIKTLAVGEQLIVHGSLSNPQRNLPDRQSWLGHYFLSVIRSLPFSLNIVVSDLLFITSNHPLEKSLDFVVIQQRFANGNSDNEVFFWIFY